MVPQNANLEVLQAAEQSVRLIVLALVLSISPVLAAPQPQSSGTGLHPARLTQKRSKLAEYRELNSRAVDCLKQGKHQEALRLLGQAFELAQAEKDRGMMATILSNMSACAAALGMPAAAKGFELQAGQAANSRLTSCAPTSESSKELNNRAVDLINQGKYREALIILHRAGDLAEKERNPRRMATVLTNFAVCVAALGDPEAARDFERRADQMANSAFASPRVAGQPGNDIDGVIIDRLKKREEDVIWKLQAEYAARGTPLTQDSLPDVVLLEDGTAVVTVNVTIELPRRGVEVKMICETTYQVDRKTREIKLISSACRKR